MQCINISDFRANLLKYLEMVNAGELISVTSNGKPLATISPPVSQQAMAKKQLLEIAENAQVYDVISPIDEQWQSMK